MNKSKGSKLRRYILAPLSILLIAGSFFIFGIWFATGGSPFDTLQRSSSYLPPNEQTVNLSQLKDVLADDNTDKQEYREGYNCVDYAWDIMRALQWKGINTGIIGIMYEDGSQHAVITVPTSDYGWIYIDPQTDKLISPYVGGYYDGKKIMEVNVMIIDWMDIAEFANDPIFYEEVK